jgi:hypothetical protein
MSSMVSSMIVVGLKLGGIERGVVLQESNSLFADTVDIRRFEAHQPVAIGADVGDADVVTKDHEDIRLAGVRSRLRDQRIREEPP